MVFHLLQLISQSALVELGAGGWLCLCVRVWAERGVKKKKGLPPQEDLFTSVVATLTPSLLLLLLLLRALVSERWSI